MNPRHLPPATRHFEKALFSADDFRRRRRAVIRHTHTHDNVDVLLITDAKDIRYLTGCTEGASALLFGRDWARLYTSKMFVECIRTQAPGVDVTIPHDPVFQQAQNAMRRIKHRGGVGFQGAQLTWQRYRQFAAAMGRRRLVDIGTAVLTCRAVKDEEELRLTRRCVRIAEKALLSMMKEGVHAFLGRSEKQIAAELQYRMCQLGADRQAFDIIVAAGSNSASCHHAPTDRKVRRGDPLLFDWGAALHGYRSDITRVLFIGAPRPKLAQIYTLVLAANRKGIATCRPGVSTHTVARQAWDVIRDGGYADNIRHGLGHGVGLEIHELPRLGTGAAASEGDVRLRSNMVITVEPGIYIKDLGGVRIEDNVRIIPNGHECLTSFPRLIDDVILA